ncbi:esterase-like activity of phytase family protein [Streptomyces sp. NPDC053560]|uniref:caspase, EACC1-associated type n=1 Tax=Streptomyces sp. NPDC053560 TaxID=3365711 RepID=UPI0037D89BD2
MTAPAAGEPEASGAGQQPVAPAAGRPLDPAKSACVLIGVGSYEHLEDLPAVRHNLIKLRELLTDPDVWGVPHKRVHVVSNPDSQGRMTDPIVRAVDEATDTLLVYYAGHGLLDARDNDLYLATPASRRGRRETALGYRVLRDLMEDAKGSVRRRIVVLDCCYSGRAANGVMAADGTTVPGEDLVAIEGSYVLTSTTENLKAEAKGDAAYTAFTGELIRLLERGDPARAGEPHLTLNQIHGTLRQTLAAKRLPRPQRLDNGGVGDLPFVRNRQPADPVAAAAPARRGPGPLVLGAAGLALLLVGAAAGTAGTLRWGPERRPAADAAPPIPGSCGKEGRATLLDVSDRLSEQPHNEYLGDEVAGLSALALTGGAQGDGKDAEGEGAEGKSGDGKDAAGEGRVSGAAGPQVLALRDGEPAQVFSIALGSPEKLRPEVTGVQGLYRSDRSKFPEFDGEGLVVEKGGGTVLASSELGPAIRRFSLADGKQKGPDLPVPDAFKPPPKGAADNTRSLESLAVTPDGKHLFAGMEGPLLGDDDVHGRHQIRIERYEGAAGKAYTPESQYAYQTEEGLFLSELVAVDETHLLALERGYISGLGNGIRVYEVDLTTADDVTGQASVTKHDNDLIAPKQLLFDLSRCPWGGISTEEPQPNPVLQNVEGMALGPELSGRYAGHRVLYMVADDNARSAQATRLYSVAVRLRG